MDPAVKVCDGAHYGVVVEKPEEVDARANSSAGSRISRRRRGRRNVLLRGSEQGLGYRSRRPPLGKRIVPSPRAQSATTKRGCAARPHQPSGGVPSKLIAPDAIVERAEKNRSSVPVLPMSPTSRFAEWHLCRIPRPHSDCRRRRTSSRRFRQRRRRGWRAPSPTSKRPYRR
jgi:hypothetical protein